MFHNAIIGYYTNQVISKCASNAKGVSGKFEFNLFESMIKVLRNLIMSMSMVVLITGCNDSKNQDVKVMEMNNDNKSEISETIQPDLNTVKDARIFFMHHSVGRDIIMGLQTLMDKTGIEVKIKRDPQAINKPLSNKNVFYHTTGGKNQFPKTKIDSFVAQVKGFNSEFVPEVAFMKFCFVDFNPDTNVEELFVYYKKKMESLKSNRPEINFAHLTVPLTSRPNTFKDKLKRIIGRQVWGDAANMKRTEFNNMLFDAFPEDPIFDIAGIESTRPDGSREFFIEDGKTYYSMATVYTDDGGHLNSLGQQRVATEMVHFLATTLRKSSEQ